MGPQRSSRRILDEIGLHFIIRLPGTKILRWLVLNHDSDGDVISFWVGHKIPNTFFVYFAFEPLKYPWTSCDVHLSINGCEKEHLFSTNTDELSDNLWIVSFPDKRLQDQLNKSNPSERNHVELICETKRLGDRSDTTTDMIQGDLLDWNKYHPGGWGVGVECICQWVSDNAKKKKKKKKPSTNPNSKRNAHV